MVLITMVAWELADDFEVAAIILVYHTWINFLIFNFVADSYKKLYGWYTYGTHGCVLFSIIKLYLYLYNLFIHFLSYLPM